MLTPDLEDFDVAPRTPTGGVAELDEEIRIAFRFVERRRGRRCGRAIAIVRAFFWEDRDEE